VLADDDPRVLEANEMVRLATPAPNDDLAVEHHHLFERRWGRR